jgi:tetratricopeptide (TPR) repeat protein
MLAHRTWTGYGLDAFASQFPRFQSAELANAYPDTYNESPHNLILDTLLSQGIGGAAFLALIAVVLAAGWRKSRNSLVFAGLIALLVSFQFFSLEITTAAYLYFTLAFLIAAELRPDGAMVTTSSIALRVCETWAAILLAIFALELAVSDWYFERTRKDLAAGNLLVSLRDFENARRWSPPGFDPSLWYSRELLNAARKANQFQAMFPEIEKSAWDAYRRAEDRQNACYHLVSVYTNTGELERANSLNNECLALAPSWYLLYWSGASLNVSLHNYDQAERMAAQAVEYSGKHRQEMLRVLEMVRSARPPPSSGIFPMAPLSPSITASAPFHPRANSMLRPRRPPPTSSPRKPRKAKPARARLLRSQPPCRSK